MTKILHLSDVHLGPPSDGQWLDDHKSGLGGHDRRAEKHVLKETLEGLERDGVLSDLSAVVISGDLTNRSEQDGFNEFPDTIEPLIDAVGAQKIVVVPGNHDVPWDPGPGAPGRYDGFCSATRAHEFVTPLLDGEDFDQNGDFTGPPSVDRHLLRGDEFVIVPLNSSHFCWGKEPLDDAAAEAVLTAGADVTKVVEELRRHDVARVSNAQLTALTQLLRDHDPPLVGPSSADPRTRIAVLHHQLLPVSANEELKSFESLSNLGAIRELLSSLDIQVVLHGHKHEAGLYWDYVADRRSLNHTPHRMVVAAAPARFRPNLPVARLLHLPGPAGPRDVRFEDLIAPGTPASRVRRGRPQTARLWRSPAVDAVNDAMALSGATVAEVYGQLRSIFAGRDSGAPLHDLLCEIVDASDAGEVPPGYPEVEGVDEVKRWMADLVEWWQLPEPQLLRYVTFNHGNRIYRHWKDQVARAARNLNESPHTTRAVIPLLDPWTDGDPKVDFPSFVLVQLQIVSRNGSNELDCTGYFRKQEMRYWWPINVAELAIVRGQVLKQVDEDVGASPGRLRTFTAYAAVEERLPTVALAAVDRAIDHHPEDLWTMAHGLVHPDGDTTLVRALWDRYLAELKPSDDGTSGELLTSYRGLRDVQRMLKWLDAADQPVARALEDLVGLYEALQEQNRRVKANAGTVGEVQRRIDKLREALDAHLDVLDSGTS